MLHLALCTCVVREETLDAALCFFIAFSVNANTQQDQSLCFCPPQTHTHTLRSAPLLPDKTAGTTLIYPLRAARIVADMHTNTECRHAHTHTIVHCLPTAGSQLRQHKAFDFILSFTFLVFCDKIIPGSLSLSQSFSLCLCWNHFLKSQMEKNHFTSLLK